MASVVPIDALVAAHFDALANDGKMPFFDLCPWRSERAEYARDVASATDVRFTPDGTSLVVCARELVFLSRVPRTSAEVFTRNAVGELGLRRVRGEVHRKAPPVLVLSVDYGVRGRLFIGSSDGTVREASNLLVTLPAPVLRVRASGDTLAIATEKGSYLWDGKLTELGGTAARGTFLELEADGSASKSSSRPFPPGLAWKGGRLAIADTRGVLVHDDALETLDEVEAHEVAFWGNTVVAARGTSLTIHAADRRVIALEHGLGELARCTALAVHGNIAALSFIGGENGRLVFVDLESGQSASPREHALPPMGSTSPLAFSPKGDAFVVMSGSSAGSAVAFDATYVANPNADRLERLLRPNGVWANLQQWQEDLAAIDMTAISAAEKQAVDRKNAEQTKRFRPNASDGGAKKVAPPAKVANDDDDEWNEGDLVMHPTFGEGVVEAVAPVSNQTKLTIRFGATTKSLISKFVSRRTP